jgi:hypothetical protein
MGKSRSKSRSELEYLRAENRQLKAENKRLKRQVHISDEIVDEVTETEPVENIKARHCDECGKGQITDIELSFMIFSECDVCGFRERKKK